jgi:hypothetical protein
VYPIHTVVFKSLVFLRPFKPKAIGLFSKTLKMPVFILFDNAQVDQLSNPRRIPMFMMGDGLGIRVIKANRMMSHANKIKD